MDTNLLENMLTDGYVVCRKHADLPLYIYNYSAKTQYERMWNEVTLACRGLILNENFEIVARPLPKFFNYGEMESQIVPDENFDVYEKMDGSLGILYWVDNKPFIATRGSFTSDQSVKANELLNSKYKTSIAQLDSSKTYLFEIIYPENRIVVDYGPQEVLVLLAIVDIETGYEEPLVDLGFPIVKKYDGLSDLATLKNKEEENKEGFVIRFSGGLRLKIKFDEYVRIHNVVTNVSSISLWELLKEGKPLDELLEHVPDEFYIWVKKKHAGFLLDFQKIEDLARQEFKVLENRKETALYFLTCTFPKVLFAMLDKRPYDEIIWRRIKPEYERPFSNNIETLEK